jgi:hypothetical protein
MQNLNNYEFIPSVAKKKVSSKDLLACDELNTQTFPSLP